MLLLGDSESIKALSYCQLRRIRRGGFGAIGEYTALRPLVGVLEGFLLLFQPRESSIASSWTSGYRQGHLTISSP